MAEKLLTRAEWIELEQKELQSKWGKGTYCGCCKQHVQLYKLKINAIATSDLIRLFRLTNGEVSVYQHVADFSRDRGGAFAKLAHWKLVESQLNEDTKKRTSGMWALTQEGAEFVLGQKKVPESAYLYNKECKALGGPMVDVRQALRNEFNYEELMKGL